MPSMHLTLSRNRTLSTPAKPTATATLPSPSAPPAPATPPKGVKRVVAGLKRRISNTFLRGHRHHASDAHPSRIVDDDEPLPSPLLIAVDAPHPIPISVSVSVSPHPHPSVDTLIRSVTDGGLGKHVADCSDSSDATSDYSSDSSVRGRAHRTESSDSGPLPEIAESLSGVEEEVPSTAPQSSGPPAIVDSTPAFDLALSIPLPDDIDGELDAEVEDAASLVSSEAPATQEDRRSIQSLYSRMPSPEALTAPLDTSLLTEETSGVTRARTLSLASFESLTAPVETSVLSEDVYASNAPSQYSSDAASTHLPLPLSTASLQPAVLDVVDEPRSRKISMLSIESLTAPLETLVLPGVDTSPPTPSVTDSFTLALSTPLPPSTPDSPLILPAQYLAPKEVQDAHEAVLEPPAEDSTTFSPTLFPAISVAPVDSIDVPTSVVSESEDSSQEESAPTLPEEVLATAVVPDLEEVLAMAAVPDVEEVPLLPFETLSAPDSPLESTHSAPSTPPLVSSDGEESEEEEEFEFHPLGLTLERPMMFFPSAKVRYLAFSSLTWWLPHSL